MGIKHLYLYKYEHHNLQKIKIIDLSNQLELVPKFSFVPIKSKSNEKNKFLIVIIENKMKYIKINYDIYNVEVLANVQLNVSVLDIRALDDHCYVLITKQNQLILMMLNNMNSQMTFFKPYDLPDIINYRVINIGNSNFPSYDSTFIRCDLIRYR